jgi:hypothetical protein
MSTDKLQSIHVGSVPASLLFRTLSGISSIEISVSARAGVVGRRETYLVRRMQRAENPDERVTRMTTVMIRMRSHHHSSDSSGDLIGGPRSLACRTGYVWWIGSNKHVAEVLGQVVRPPPKIRFHAFWVNAQSCRRSRNALQHTVSAGSIVAANRGPHLVMLAYAAPPASTS